MQADTATYNRVMQGWERAETSDGVPYYMNHKVGRTQWDHPYVVKIYEELRSLDDICYAAYRTASKLILLQERLGLNKISLSSVANVCERHGLSKLPTLDFAALSYFLQDLLTLKDTSFSEVKDYTDLTSEQLAELCLNWLTALYDKHRTGHLPALAVKTCLVALCNARLVEKYKWIFQQAADIRGEISRTQLTLLFQYFVRIIDILGESTSFGGMNVEAAVDSCFKGSFNPTGVCNDVFLNWLLKEPQTLVWLPTMHRIIIAQSVQHDFKCSVCKAYPIVGLRYRCLKCFNYELCQNCFFRGQVSKKHKLKHPTQEYCVATTSKENTKAFVKTIRNNLYRRSQKQKKLRYLPVYGGENPPKVPVDLVSDTASDFSERNAAELWDRESEVDRMYNSPRSTGFGDPERQELESIIVHLEKENKNLIRAFKTKHLRGDQDDDSVNSQESDIEWLEVQNQTLNTKNNIMEAHNKALQQQLDRLKNILHKPVERKPFNPISQNIPTKLHNLKKVQVPEEYQQAPVYEYTEPEVHIATTPEVQPLFPNINRLKTPGGRSVNLEDLTLGSIDGSLGRTHFSLPELPDNSQDQEGDEDIKDILSRLDRAFPANMSMADDLSGCETDNLLIAASGIGNALLSYVRSLDSPEDNGSSLWGLAEELGATHDTKDTFSSTRGLDSVPRKRLIQNGHVMGTPPMGIPIDLSGGMSSA